MGKDSLEQYSLILKANANLVSSILDDSNASITCIRPAVDGALLLSSQFLIRGLMNKLVQLVNMRLNSPQRRLSIR